MSLNGVFGRVISHTHYRGNMTLSNVVSRWSLGKIVSAMIVTGVVAKATASSLRLQSSKMVGARLLNIKS